MAETLYFQWQNEYLLKTIYPLREMKLRDFLVYFAEIDLWAQYKNTDSTTLQQETQAYTKAQATAIAEAYQAYTRLRKYFLTADVRAEYAAKFTPLDETILAKINQLHAMFVSYLPKLTDVRKEKNFVTQLEPQWVENRAEARRLIAAKKRRIEGILPNHPNRPLELKQLEQMEKVLLPMVEAELSTLRAFIASFEKIETRKLELYQAKEKGSLRKQEITRKLAALDTSINPLEAKLQTISAELARLKAPPDAASLQNYFATPDVSSLIRARHNDADPGLLNQVNTFHKALMDEFKYIKDERVKLSTLRNHLYNWQMHLKSLEKEALKIETNLRNMPPTWAKRAENEAALARLKNTSLEVMQAEVEKLASFQAAFEFATKPKAELEKTIQAKEQELLKIQQNLAVFQKDAATLQTELKSIEATLATDEEKYLLAYNPSRPVTLKDIVRWKVEEIQNAAARKNHLELLEEVVQYFLKNPRRFPLWLQYMVIHFSGMRYASAHGSWASPRDLLLRLHSSKIEKELGKVDDATTEKLGRETTALYASANAPRLGRTTDKNWKTRLETNLKNVISPGPKTRRSALIALKVDERRYELETMSEDEALATLESMKASFPRWAWKEIVRLTPLRVNHVNDLNWEKLTPEEEAERSALPFGDDLREIMSKWKEENTSLWRDEHGRAHRLIVSRAVCNETAEHCQHLRGHLPPGGLTAKAPWYMKNEKEGTLPGTPRPYFTKPKSIQDYTVGASVLWVRFVTEDPNPWRIARPLKTKDGDGLIAPELMSRRGNANTTSWIYSESDMVRRTRTTIGPDKQKITQEQWLRWIHEATVAEVAETADGPVVLTFETALPDDDPGLSSIGLFKHSLSNMLYDGTEEAYNRSFVGFVPEGKLPVADLEVMLDWNKILRRQVMTPTELEAYRQKYIRAV